MLCVCRYKHRRKVGECMCMYAARCSLGFFGLGFFFSFPVSHLVPWSLSSHPRRGTVGLQKVLQEFFITNSTCGFKAFSLRMPIVVVLFVRFLLFSFLASPPHQLIMPCVCVCCDLCYITCWLTSRVLPWVTAAVILSWMIMTEDGDKEDFVSSDVSCLV